MAWKKTDWLGNWGEENSSFFNCVIVATMDMCYSGLLVQEAPDSHPLGIQLQSLRDHVFPGLLVPSPLTGNYLVLLKQFWLEEFLSAWLNFSQNYSEIRLFLPNHPSPISLSEWTEGSPSYYCFLLLYSS